MERNEAKGYLSTLTSYLKSWADRLSRKLFSKRKTTVLFVFTSAIVFIFFSMNPVNNPYESEKLILKEPLVKALPFSVPSPAVYPVMTVKSSPPELTATSALVLDLDSAKVLFQKNLDTPLAPASTTKIMTAVVALEAYKLTDVLTVSNLQTEGSLMGLVEGERISVENLLYGLLVKSGNDAAYVLAASYPSGYEQFIYSMNKKAEELNMKNTHFVNSSGLPEKNHFTTARDFSCLTAYALKNPFFNKIIKTKRINISSVDKVYWHDLESTNSLLGQDWIDGVKTGWTQEAGQCLVASATKDKHRVVSVLLNSSDRFGETSSLLNYIFSSYRW